MKVAIINFTFAKKTGIEILADNIMQQIDKIDKVNDYVLIVNEQVQDFYKMTPRISKKVVTKMASSQMLKTIWLLVIYPIYSLIKGIDITIVMSGTSNFSLSPFTRNIVFIADLGEYYIENKYDRKRMIYRKYLTLPANKLMADLFIAISHSTEKAIMEKLKVSGEKIKLIYCGTDERIQKYDKHIARKKIGGRYDVKDTSNIIITIGRIDPIGKNLINLIRAAEILKNKNKDFHLFLLGGESSYSDTDLVPREIQRRQLSGYVTMTGYVDVDTLNDFYNASDMLVFPSIHEGFGLPLLEAVKCEVPVTCSDIDVFHEVGDDAVLYFDPHDPDDIADKMALLLSDTSLKETLILKGKKRFPKFTWEESAKELIKILQQ
jgi:glycosyltransferase involved in cell wall biosynthesis